MLLDPVVLFGPVVLLDPVVLFGPVVLLGLVVLFGLVLFGALLVDDESSEQPKASSESVRIASLSPPTIVKKLTLPLYVF